MASSSKRGLSHLQDTKMRCPREILEDEDGPVKKKLKKNLMDIFNRASMCVNAVGTEDHMNVFLRIKPFTSNDNDEEKRECLKVIEEERAVIASAPEVSQTHRNLKRFGKSEHKFTFSKIFNDTTSQAEFFNQTMLNMTKDFISGQNSLVFTYGVTSSGKTYTIQGKPQDAGILPRSLDVLFNSIQGKQIKGIKFKPSRFTDVMKLRPEEAAAEQRIKERVLKMSSDEDTTMLALLGDETISLSSTIASCSSQDESIPDMMENRVREELKLDVDDVGEFNYTIWVSFAEIYNEQIYDLLEHVPTKKGVKRSTLRISDDQNGSPFIKGLNEIHVENADEAYRLLTIGKKNLQIASTRLNHCSSRSHSIFTMKVIRVVDKDDPNIARVSLLSFCDLAGSERYSKTQASGDRLKEAGNINTSLLTLGRCIEILRYNQIHRENSKVVPFRESKLTRLFQNFFNGSGRAAMIVNVSQCASMFDETLQVFKFSAIAKQVKPMQKAMEPLKPKRKVYPPLPRPSIQWEKDSLKLLGDASNEPLPDDSEEDLSVIDEASEVDQMLSEKSTEELIIMVKFLMEKNSSLADSLEEEIINSSNIDFRVRREVCENMKKQQVLIEKEYSKQFEEFQEDSREATEERIQNIINIYERKLERLQRKVDDDDEWVSSILLFQEERKVKARDEKIAELENELKQKDEVKIKEDKEKDGKIEILEEYIADLRSLNHNDNKEKNEKIEELESYIQEAGDEYQQNMKVIEKLKEEVVSFALQKKAQEEKFALLQSKYQQAEESNRDCVKEVEQLNEKVDLSAKEMEAKDKCLAEIQSQYEQVVHLHKECIREIEQLKEKAALDATESENKMQSDYDQIEQLYKDSVKEIELLKEKADLSSKENEEKNKSLAEIQSQYEQIEQLHRECVKENEQLKEKAALNAKECEEKENNEIEMKSQYELIEKLHKESVREIEQLKEKAALDVKESEEKVKCLTEMQAQYEKMEQLHKASVKEIEQLKEKAAQDAKESGEKVVELETLVKEWEGKLENKDTTIKSLEEECEQMQGEIERLQDQMSQMGDTSKRSILESSSVFLEEKSEMGSCDNTSQTNGMNMDEIDSLKAQNNVSEKEISSLLEKISTLEEELKTALIENSSLKENVEKLQNIEDEVVGLKQTNELLNKEILTLQNESKSKVLAKNSLSTSSSLQPTMISQMVKNLETTPGTPYFDRMKQSQESNMDSDDEIVFSKVSSRSLDRHSESQSSIDSSAIRVKEAELTINALRNKLQREKDDFFEREQALIHGFTAEIDNLKLELVKLRNKSISSKDITKEDRSTCVSSSMDTGEKEKEESKHSVTLLLGEISTLQEELHSCKEAYGQLQSKLKESLSVENKGKRVSTQAVCNLPMADSILQFEMTEFSVELDTWKNKVEELNQKLQEKEKMLNEVCDNAERIQGKLDVLKVSKETVQRQLEEEQEKNIRFESQVKGLEERLEELQCVVKEKDSAFEQKASKLNAALFSNAVNTDTIDQLTAQVKTLEEDLVLKKKLAEEKDVELQKVEKNVSDLKTELNILQEMYFKLKEEYDNDKSNESSLDDVKKELQEAVINNCKLKEENGKLEKELDEHKLSFRELETELDKYRNDVNDKDTELHDVQLQLDEKKEMVVKMTQSIEKMEQDYQQQSAEVSQKLILLEKEKRISERKLNELRSKEEDWQTKFEVQEQKFEAQKTHLSEVEGECSSLRKIFDEANKQNEELANNVKDLKNGLQESDETTELQEKLIQDQDERMNDLKSSLEEVTKVKESLENALSEKENELKDLTEMVKKNQDGQADLTPVLEKLQNIIHEKTELEAKIEKMEIKNQSLEDELDKKNQESLKAKEKIMDFVKESTRIKSEVNEWKNKVTAIELDLEKSEGFIEKHKEENSILKSKLETMKKEHEKDLESQEGAKKKVEQMELWKKEKDQCVAKFEEMYQKVIEDKKELGKQIEKLKKDNADLVQQFTKSKSAQDKLIADLRKNNNTLSIELASQQGMLPPPKVDTPDRDFQNPGVDFIEDIDTTGHLEIDATPPAALKKKRKRQGSNKSSCGIVEEVFTPMLKSLKTIEETNEKSPCSSDPDNRILSSVSSDVLSTLSPLTRSGRNQGRGKEKKKCPSTALAWNDLQNENDLPARRSSRLRSKSTSKQSMV